MDIFTIPDEMGMYDTLSFWAIFVASSVFLLYAYYSIRVSKLTQVSIWRWVFRIISAICCLVGVGRFYILFSHFQEEGLKIAFPITGMTSWILIGLVGYLEVKFIERASKRSKFRKEEITLMDNIQEHVVEKVLRGENPSKRVIESYKKQSAELTARP